ncbi:MAG TPA: 3-methyl-2-oxobutanoate hydroxymethyltransferase [Candidatus Dormibacteraeota bacterium]|nr:3-methyl-2-oxobutanoate hydroxymethyltransferase [Candidatus Dormibacteraeota bacterium]
MPASGRPVTVRDLETCKREGRRFAVVTAYDYTTARILDAAGIPVLLVGDSLGMLMLGYPSTLPVGMDEMLHHARAVARGAPEKLLVGDMPFDAYHASDAEAVHNAAAFLKAGMNAVKIEGGGRVVGLAAHLVERGIPVMGHLGLTPQFFNAFGGMRVQGRSGDDRRRILDDALALQDAGAFSLVLEGVPRDLGAEVTAALRIPTIGIGAGPDCDAQVLVVHDLLGLTQDPMPKFVRAYGDLGARAVDALTAFAADVAAGSFPDDAHSYH